MTKMKRIKSGRFTQIANTIFEDARLSYKEIGLYCNMMKFPDDWEFSIRYLADLHQDKKAAVTTGLEKLIELGYIAKVGSQQRNKQGTFSTYDYVIFEDPTDNPKFIPYRHGKAETTVSDFQTTESWVGEITATDFQIADDICTETAVNSSNYVSDDYKTVADNQTAVEALQCTVSDYRITDYPTTDYRLTENQPITNTVDTNTFYTNTFLPNIEEDDDDTCTRVDIEAFQWKFINSYLNEYLNAPSEKERMEIDQTFNAMVNAAYEITDPKAIAAVDAYSSEEMGNLFIWVYRNLFSTRIGGVVKDVTDKTAYLKKVISNQAKASFGPSPFNVLVRQSS